MTDDPTKKAPIDITPAVTVEPTRNGWVEVDLSSQEIRVERDHKYYISIGWLTDKKPVFARATGISQQDLYAFRNNTWKKFYYGIKIQHIVSRALEETVTFPKISTSTATVPPTKTLTQTTAAARETSTTTAATGFTVTAGPRWPSLPGGNAVFVTAVVVLVTVSLTLFWRRRSRRPPAAVNLA
jgi:hypothetical protein